MYCNMYESREAKKKFYIRASARLISLELWHSIQCLIVMLARTHTAPSTNLLIIKDVTIFIINEMLKNR